MAATRLALRPRLDSPAAHPPVGLGMGTLPARETNACRARPTTGVAPCRGPAKQCYTNLSRHLIGRSATPCNRRRTLTANATPTSGGEAQAFSFDADGSAKNVLVGDIGGTNARLQVWAVTSEDESELVFEKIYPTKDFPTFASVLQELESETEGVEISTACFAVAGPVVDQVCNMTNLGWIIDKAALEKQFGYRVGVLNDFEAVGYGVRFVDPSKVLVLNEYPATPKAPIAVLGPGTGLGEAQLFWDESQDTYRVYPSEGSHADFAPRGWKQRALAQFVESELGFCEVESVGCGAGLERIYEFLSTDEGPHQEPLLALEIFMMSVESLEEERAPAKKTAPEISEAALGGEDPVAREAVDMMLSIIGAEAGHMALRSLARGGVYIAGGITPKVIERVRTGGLATAFLSHKGRFYSFLKTIPLYVIMDDKVGLLGSKVFGIQLLKKQLAEQS